MSASTLLLLCIVVGVHDGDTLTARCGAPDSYQQLRVRLAGIDAPERKQAYGDRSRRALSDLCYGVEARIDALSKDRYGRTVADVWCRGQDAGRNLVGIGMAWVYDRYSARHEYLYPLQDAARSARLGLWSDVAPTPPWKFRHKK